MNAEWRALLALFVGAIGIGVAPLCVRLSTLDPVAIAFWRLLLAVPLLWWLARRAGQAGFRGPISRGEIGAGLAFAGDLAVWHFAILYTTVANATLLANFAPVFIALWSIVVLGQRLGLGYWLGLALALTGAAVLVGASLEFGWRAALGDGLGILTAVFYAAYQLAIKSARAEAGTARVMLRSTLISALVLLPLTLLGERAWPTTLHDWTLVLVLAGVSQVLGQGLIAFAMAQLQPTIASVGLLVQPVAAALLAWWLLQETLTAQQLIGGVIVLLAIPLCRVALARAQR